MAEKSLWTNVTLPPSNDQPGSGWWSTQGVRFTVSSVTTAVGAKWYRISSGAPALGKLRLWRVSDQLMMREIDPAPDNGAVGWQRADFNLPVELETGVDYVITSDFPNNYSMAYKTTPLPAPENPLSFDSPFHMASSNQTYGFPGTHTNIGFAFLIDIVVNSDVPPPSSDIGIEIENGLTRWLAANADNTRQDHLPWLTKAVVDTIAATQGTHTGLINAVAPAVVGAGGPTLAQLANQVATAVGIGLLETAIKDYISSIFKEPTDPDNTGIAVERIENALALTTGRQIGPVGGTGWSFLDALTGVGSVQWVQPADAYTFTMIDAQKSMRFVEQIGIGIIRNWRAWAKPFDGTFWYPEHVQVNGPDCVIRWGTLRWPGIGLNVPADVEWELHAYNYTGEL